MIFGLLLALLLVATPAWAATFVASNNGNDAAGTACTDAQPCSVRRGLITMNCATNDVLELLDGVYTGTNYMVDLDAHVPNKSGTSDANRCTVRARNDGAVFINGQLANRPLNMGTYNNYTRGNSWWTIQGIDVGNSPASVINISNSHNNKFQRICASNISNATINWNEHVILNDSSSNNLWEDICAFGTGRNTVLEYSENGTSVNNTWRRIWTRHEGWRAGTGLGSQGAGGPNIQLNYGTGNGINRFENVITIWSGEQTQPGWACYFAPGSYAAFPGTPPNFNGAGCGLVGGAYISRDTGSTDYRFRGWISYGRLTAANYNQYSFPVNWFWFAHHHVGHNGLGTGAASLVDMFVDTSGIPTGAFVLNCETVPCNATADRLTAIQSTNSFQGWGETGQSTSILGPGAYTVTNANECTALGTCPNFYTGTTPGTGARNCFEYTNGVLGTVAATQGLWPWRMDGRIKAALTRARNAGIGGTALAGGAGPGYEANTVTSEIVSRYGEVPPGCTRSPGAPFVPNFPVVTDFPSTPVLDTFNRANGGLGANWTTTLNPGTPFTIVNNQAQAPAGAFARMQWNASTFTAAHEVHAAWSTAPTETSLLTFGGVAGLDVSQYRVVKSTVASGNSGLAIQRFDGAGNGTTILGPIDLGTAIGANQGLGVRVSPLQTISLYWKYLDGNQYRIGTVIDTNLPTANAAIGFAGFDPTIINDFGGGTCCGGAVNPASIGRFGNRFPTP